MPAADPSSPQRRCGPRGESENSGGDFDIALGAAFVALAVWLAALIALALVRTDRDEY